jgi:signal transduction histidine kinase
MNTVRARHDGVDDERFVDLLASSVHDIKNSIGLLLAAADAVQADTPPDSATRTGLSTLQHEARRINYDLVHLLGLFKFDRMRAAVQLSVVDCQELLDEIAAYNGELLAARGITLDIRPAGAPEGYFDRELVLGVLNSVVNNAFRHARARVGVRCEVHDGHTFFSVVDDGPGYGPRLLDATGEEPGTTSYGNGNTGLGLYFARRIAAMHEHRGRRGRVVLRNDSPSGGGCFELWLP